MIILCIYLSYIYIYYNNINVVYINVCHCSYYLSKIIRYMLYF